jgi:hypothetical protein
LASSVFEKTSYLDNYQKFIMGVSNIETQCTLDKSISIISYFIAEEQPEMQRKQAATQGRSCSHSQGSGSCKRSKKAGM